MCKKIQRRPAATPSASASFPAPLMKDSCDESSASLLIEDIIVAEILPRLHVKALFRFKCVAKRYESIISDPVFARKYLQLAYSSPESSSSSGLSPSLLFPFMDLSFYGDLFTENVKDLSAGSRYADDGDELSIPVSTVSLPCDDVRQDILGSSGGLLLSFIPPPLESSTFERFSLCVSNPLTKQYIQLPNSSVTTRTYLTKFGFATRWDHTVASLTYKVVIIKSSQLRPSTVLVFSSDTGNWVAWEVRCPKVFCGDETAISGFSYKGILHWLDRVEGSILTYDPYDNPGRFGRITLPVGKYSISGCKRNKHKSLIYSGEEEVLKYCEIGKCESEPDFERLMVWRLEDYGKGKWRLEGEFSVPRLVYACKRLMVAPYPWNRNVICHPYLRSKSITAVNPWAGTRKLVDIFTGLDACLSTKTASYFTKFHLAELCPWSSPFYALPKSAS